jgi:hypothetical protein
MILKGYYYNHLPFWIELLAAVLICYLNILLFVYIIDKNEKLYEVLSLVAFVIESVAILSFTTILFHEYLFDINSTLSIFALALASPVYEGYEQSIKPLIIKAYLIIRQKLFKINER